MAAASSLLAFLVAGVALASSSFIEGVSAEVDGDSRRSHQPFVPLVAFKCGYRNQYLRENGEWHSDDSSLAQCLEGKYDILKYCKRVYPGKNVTNIVEYSHESSIDRWCKEDGTQCKHSFVVRPFRCIINEFETESLQVPGQCHFAHFIGRNTCNDYKHWNNKAEEECLKKVIDGEQMALRSFAILEPCGLDMFRGVEFVCCPKNKLAPAAKQPAKLITEDEDEDDDDDDEAEDERDDSDEDSKARADDKEEELAKLDPYFKEDDTANEHDRFKEAEERLEKKHRKKVTKVIAEWSELFERYNKMKENDPKGAEEYKREMTARFRKTVASLEEENKEQRQQIEEVHDHRVQALLNEKKRLATHEYRAALALHVGAQNKQNVLKSLKSYIRTEEKDRTHMLNRYRHLLRSDTDEANAFEPILIHRLRYIDLRINGTLAMLRDFPELEKQIKPIAVEFWREYRRENTPEVNDDELTALGDEDANEKLVQLYKKTYERTAPLTDRILVEPSTTTTTVAPKKVTVSLKSILSGKPARLEQDSDSEEDSDSSESEEKPLPKKIHISVQPEKKRPEEAKKVPLPADTDEDEDYEGDDDEEELHVVVEAIKPHRPLSIHEEVPEQNAFARKEKLINDIATNDEFGVVSDSSNAIMMGALLSVLTVIVMIAVVMRRRTRYPGFIEVDVCTPEERHVAGMQVTGYENPTYSFFDAKA